MIYQRDVKQGNWKQTGADYLDTQFFQQQG